MADGGKVVICNKTNSVDRLLEKFAQICLLFRNFIDIRNCAKWGGFKQARIRHTFDF